MGMSVDNSFSFDKFEELRQLCVATLVDAEVCLFICLFVCLLNHTASLKLNYSFILPPSQQNNDFILSYIQQLESTVKQLAGNPK